MERSLVDRLRDHGYLTPFDCDRVDRELSGYASAAECLLGLGVLEEAALRRAIGRITSAPAIDLVGKTVEPGVLALVGARLARKLRCLPLFLNESQDRRGLFLGLEDPAQRGTIDEVVHATGLNVEPVVVGSFQLSEALDRFYPASTLDLDAGGGAALSANDARPIDPVRRAPVDELPPVMDDAEIAGKAEIGVEAEAVGDAAADAFVGEVGYEAAAAAESGEREPETPTRIILQALTKILIADGMIESADLMAEVHRVQAKEQG